MDYVRKLIGVGSDKRIIVLGPGNTKNYLAAQCIDILHDAAGNSITNNNVRMIALLQTVWILRNNPHLQRDPQYLLNYIIDGVKVLNPSDKTDVAGSVLGTHNEENLQNSSGKISIVLDNCSNKTTYCKGNDYRVLYQDTLYDLGAYQETCLYHLPRNKRGYPTLKISNPPRVNLGTFRTNYYDNPNVIKKFGNNIKCDITGANCHGLPQVLSNRDNVIIGYMPLSSGKYQAFVLAYQGVGYIDFNDRYRGYYFVNAVHENFQLSRGMAASAGEVAELFKDYRDFYFNRIANKPFGDFEEDLLLIYTEFMAKHWGDLGLIFEALEDRYVVTDDNIMCLLCRILNVNYIQAKKFTKKSPSIVSNDIAPNTVSTIVYENNTAHIFDVIKEYTPIDI